ncbi:MAG: patatin-like phospholipase family protein, partial [Pseudomonadota bacterium]
MNKNYIALVLQGGGALGAYEYGVLKALYEQNDFSPDIISGVSIGAFSAAVLTGAVGDPVKALGELWKCFTTKSLPLTPQPVQLAMSLMYNQGMYSPNPNAYWNPGMSTHFYNTDLLYTTLNKIIDLDKLNSKQSPHLIITATNIETGQLDLFDNREMDITFEHIVASGSLPPSFPMVDIDDNSYWDGGLFSNTPLKPAFKALEKLGTDKDQREMILVELFAHSGKKPQNMSDVFDRMIEITFECKIRHDSKQYQRINQYVDLMQAIDKELPEDSKLKNEPIYQKLLSYKKI